MQWVLNGEVDVTAHEGTLYIIDSECRPCVNRLDGKGTQPIGPDQATDEKGLSRSLLNFASGGLPVSAPRSSILRHVSNRTVGRGQRVQGADQVA